MIHVPELFSTQSTWVGDVHQQAGDISATNCEDVISDVNEVIIAHSCKFILPQINKDVMHLYRF